MARNFNSQLVGFRDSIADYGYYIDFEKVHRNVDGIKVELNILNSLIGSKNIKDDFKALIKKYPGVFKMYPSALGDQSKRNILPGQKQRLFVSVRLWKISSEQ